MQLSLSDRLYIYYRIGAAGAPACIAAVSGLQRALMQRHPGLQAALLAKQPGGLTLMETYRWSPAAGVAAQAPDWPALEAELAACVRPWIDGDRHTEVFRPCA